MLANHGIPISMDGKGGWRDNVFVERLWRSVKYEEVYLRAYDTVSDARASIGRYLDFYNGRRPHRALTARRPIKPTSPRCPSAWQPKPGRRSTYRRGKSVQTTGTTSELISAYQKCVAETVRRFGGRPYFRSFAEAKAVAQAHLDPLQVERRGGIDSGA